MQNIDFWHLLALTQEHISEHYAATLTDKEKLSQLKNYIEKYLRDMNYSVEGYSLGELIDAIYCEMAEYSVLTKYLGSPQLEEINVNSWNDIALTYLDGSIVKIREHFHSPQHAVDIIKRLHRGICRTTPVLQRSKSRLWTTIRGSPVLSVYCIRRGSTARCCWKPNLPQRKCSLF